MSDYFRDLLLMSIIISPIYIALTIQSLKYYAAKYRISQEAVKALLNVTIFPVNIFVSRNLSDIYYLNSEYTSDQLMKSARIKRLILSLLPILYILISVFRLISHIYNGTELVYIYIIYLLISSLGLFFSWYYGRKLNHEKYHPTAEN